MAITIPTVKRNDTSAGFDTVGRSELNTSGLVNANIKTAEIIGNTLTKGLDTYVDHKVKAQETYDKLKGEEKYTQLYTELQEPLAKFKNIPDGQDPTEAKSQLEEHIKNRTDEYLSDPGLTSGMKDYLKNKIYDLNRTVGHDIISTGVVKGMKYKESVYDSSLAIDKGNLGSTVLYTNFSNEESVNQLDSKLVQLKEKIGNKDINIKSNPKDDQKTYSNIIASTLDNLLANDRIEDAQNFLKRYGNDQTLGDVKSTLIDKLNNAVNKRKVTLIAESVRGKSNAEAQDLIDKSLKNPEDRRTARTMVSSDQSQIEALKNRTQRLVYENSVAQLQNMMKSGKTWATQEELEKDFGSQLKNMKESQRRAFINNFSDEGRPLKSSLANVTTLINAEADGSLYNKSKPEFDEMIAGLSRPDAIAWTKKAMNPPTQKSQAAMKEVKSILADTFYKNKGTMTAQDKNHFTVEVSRFIEEKYPEVYAGNLPLNERKEKVAKVVQEIKSNFTPPNQKSSSGGLSSFINMLSRTQQQPSDVIPKTNSVAPSNLTDKFKKQGM